ncbi:exopolysaccharide production protein ExoZ [Rhizobium sp. RU35A]|uniref:acyltransferase family protein n=1 Tax=Rhizobium sp. RU35A TaxID=1907414 RepID=UPI000957063A|nr:acyltransferase [Rhizobium sp. RU35A]SIQ10967.1 exopolysaccharide production protein ExoZ [Rhizobium sp. RU35A]
MKTLYGIQYLRAIAALAVVLFHAAERSGENFAIGAAGVDVFFVVSGFIMMVISHNRQQTPASFLRERILRIVPSYWIVTSIMVFGGALGLFPNLVLDLPHLIGSYFFLPVPSPNGGALWPVLVQGWTLNYEMFFYLAFAATLLLPEGRRLAALALLFGLLVATGLMIDAPGEPLLFYTQPILLEFLAGAVIGRLWLGGQVPRTETGLMLIAGAVLAFAAIYLTNMDFSTAICAPLAIALVLGVLALEKGEALPPLPGLAYLGDASYSIYLWHTLAISVVLKIGLALSLPAPLIAWIGALAGTLLGILCYEGLERPLQHFIKHRRLVIRRPRRQPAE